MKLATLKKLERAAYALMTAVEKERKTDFKAGELYDTYCKLWQEHRKLFHAANIAAATRRDKGEVLFTIFQPDINCVREIVRTSHRKIVRHFWRRKFYGAETFEQGDPNTEVCHKWDPPSYTFDYYMHRSGAAEPKADALKYPEHKPDNMTLHEVAA